MAFLSGVITGPYEAYIASLDRAVQTLRSTVKKAVTTYAKEVRTQLVEGVRGQKFSLPANTPDYAARKARLYGQQTPLLASQDYVNHIQVVEEGEEIRVGFPTGAVHNSGVPYDALAAWLEFGTRSSRPRAHWRPAIEWAKQRVQTVGKAVILGLKIGAR